MEVPYIYSWETKTNENGVVMATINRDKLVEILTFLETIENKNKLKKLINSETDVMISEKFRGRLLGHREESYLVQYNHNEQIEFVKISDVKEIKNNVE